MIMNKIIDGDFYIYASLARIEVLGLIGEETTWDFLWRSLQINKVCWFEISIEIRVRVYVLDYEYYVNIMMIWIYTLL